MRAQARTPYVTIAIMTIPPCWAGLLQNLGSIYRATPAAAVIAITKWAIAKSDDFSMRSGHSGMFAGGVASPRPGRHPLLAAGEMGDPARVLQYLDQASPRCRRAKPRSLELFTHTDDARHAVDGGHGGICGERGRPAAK
jgi:hypothetical protein